MRAKLTASAFAAHQPAKLKRLPLIRTWNERGRKVAEPVTEVFDGQGFVVYNASVCIPTPAWPSSIN